MKGQRKRKRKIRTGQTGRTKRMRQRKTQRSRTQRKIKRKRRLMPLKAGSGKVATQVSSLPLYQLKDIEKREALAKLYFISLHFVSSESDKLERYKSHLQRKFNISEDDIGRYIRLLAPNSWFLKWIVGGVGHLLGVTLGIWIYTQVGDPDNDSSFKKGIAGGGALVGMLHQLFTEKGWPTFSGWVNSQYQKSHSVTLSDSEIDEYLECILKEWKAILKVEPTFDVSCGLDDFKTHLLIV